jgi:REP element-mobilizing transposase RayT
MLGDWGTDRTLLFQDDADRLRFSDRLADRVEQYHVRLYLFVLMTNHFHLVFETPEANCSKFMHSLSTAYTVYYNLRHSRHGHLLDGRYKAKLVEGDDYLLALSRYVHLNPVQVGALKSRSIQEKIKALRSYQWSSYPSYIGESKAFDFVEYAPVRSEMDGKRRTWPKRYREFVETGLAENDRDFKAALKASPRSIGSDGFRAWIDELYEKAMTGHGAREDISFRRITEPLDSGVVLSVLADVFKVDAKEFRCRRRDSVLRAVAARCLTRYAGQSQREVAVLLEAGSGSAISKQLARQAEVLSKDREVASLVKKAEGVLDAKRSERNPKS